MRRYIYIFGLTVLFWGTSCADFINIQPENATTYSNYYKNEKELEAVLTGLQVYLRQAVGEFTGGDISRAGEILDYDRSSRKGLTLSNVGTWKYYYYTIYQANLILENTHRFKGDPEKLKPYIQQAYFAKAVAYFYLAMNYGQAPRQSSGSATSYYRSTCCRNRYGAKGSSRFRCLRCCKARRCGRAF